MGGGLGMEGRWLELRGGSLGRGLNDEGERFRNKSGMTCGGDSGTSPE